MGDNVISHHSAASAGVAPPTTAATTTTTLLPPHPSANNTNTTTLTTTTASTTTTTTTCNNTANNAVAAASSVTSWDLTKPLPKLPVPELSKTMEKYLTLLSTVLSKEELSTTKKHVHDFLQQGGWGEKLQDYLLQRQAQTDNWVYDWWLKDMYLRIPLALPINSNPGMMCPRQRFSGQHDQLGYAAKFVCGLLDFKTMIDSSTIPVETCRSMEAGQPLCMEQHYRMFSSYRRPGIPLDQQLTTLGRNIPPYVIVACKDQFYVLDLEQDGVQLSEGELMSQLTKVAILAEFDCVSNPPVGVLTSINRARWAEARARLSKDAKNADNLDVIENSLFLLCLDKPVVPASFGPEADMGLADAASHVLHGQGTTANTCNRWYDKTINVVIAEDGHCGMNYEHSVAEGLAPVGLIEHALNYAASSQGSQPSHQQETRQLTEPTRLLWTVTSETQADIEQASEEINTLIESLDLAVLYFDDYGRNFPKSQGFSPDAYIQLALQLTYYKLHGHLVTTYESASIRRFRKGRVDNVRANSPAALEWIESMLGVVEATTEEKYDKFRAAAKWQQKYQIEAVLGHGIDCHLVGLREAASELGVVDSIPLFSDPSFAKINYFQLSTSQVATTTQSFICYGPVVPDGYGACYDPFPDHIVVLVTSFLDCEDTDSHMFIHSLDSSFLQMRELCLQGKEPAAS